ncbi:MAG: Uncharacterized protein G01um101438_1016 [Parcubacteria group bacterium Gr01-1014_38]|nr:MAG: Uncharacterized protein G01um101438_1016 [Parcubacteria group bacterium Gr01-1014_38]
MGRTLGGSEGLSALSKEALVTLPNPRRSIARGSFLLSTESARVHQRYTKGVSQAVECEVRSFLTDEQYQRLRDFFHREATFLGEDEQVTYYFNGEHDLRIQQNTQYAKIWLKKGALHDESREELEVRVPREQFEILHQLFVALGYEVTIQWFRKRLSFQWNDIEVSLDDTKGYGRILELEKRTALEDAETTTAYLKSKLEQLGIPLTPKAEFDQRYAQYKEH